MYILFNLCACLRRGNTPLNTVQLSINFLKNIEIKFANVIIILNFAFYNRKRRFVTV